MGVIRLSLLITLTIRTSDIHVTIPSDDKATRERTLLWLVDKEGETKKCVAHSITLL